METTNTTHQPSWSTPMPQSIMPKPVDKDQWLTEHFSLKEMTLSATAISYGWNNDPIQCEVDNLRALCLAVLEPLRKRFGVIRITSGFRCKAVNDAVGGARESQHLYGQAADIYIPNDEVGQKMFLFLKENVVFDQLIYEVDEKKRKRWLHVSFRSDGHNRRHAFMNYRPSNNVKKKIS